MEDQQGEPTLVTSTYLGPVAGFPLRAREVTAPLHRQLLLLAALAVVQDVVVGVDTHGSPPPRAPTAALGALRDTHPVTIPCHSTASASSLFAVTVE